VRPIEPSPLVRRLLAGAVDLVEPLVVRLATGVGLEDALVPSPTPVALVGWWTALLPPEGLAAHLHLADGGRALLIEEGGSTHEGAWGVEGARRSPRLFLELPGLDEAMRAPLELASGDVPEYWTWGTVRWFSREALETGSRAPLPVDLAG
jgi:hypothetical protein